MSVLPGKIFAAFLAPFPLALLLLAAIIVFRRRKLVVTGLLVAAFLLLLVPSLPLVSDQLIESLENQYHDTPESDVPAAQAIVVLGGTIRSPTRRHPESHIIDPSDRLLVALRLYRAGKAPVIICSGGKFPQTGSQDPPPESQAMSALLQEWGVPTNAVAVESSSFDTHQNALYTYRLLAPRGIQSILLVTSATHMPRAAATFRKAGFTVTPVPADFRANWDGDGLSWIPNASSIGDFQRALHELAGLWLYRVRGWA